MKVVINSYKKLNKLELGVIIKLEDVKDIAPHLDNWQAQHVLARLTREHDTGAFYATAINEIEKWSTELYPKTDELGAKTPETSE